MIPGIVDLVNLRKSFTSTHKTFENAMAKLDMLLGFVVFLISVIAFLIAFDAGVQQYAVGVSSVKPWPQSKRLSQSSFVPSSDFFFFFYFMGFLSLVAVCRLCLYDRVIRQECVRLYDLYLCDGKTKRPIDE